MRRAAAVLALGLTITAACSHSNSTAPTSWAGSLCSDLDTWLTSVKTGADKLRQAQTHATTLGQTRKQLVAYLDTAVAATDRLLRTRDARPAIPNGDALAAELKRAVEKAKQVFEDGRTRARALPIDDATAYRAQAQALGASIGRAGADLQSSVSAATRRYRSAAVEQALHDTPTCRRLGANAGTGSL